MLIPIDKVWQLYYNIQRDAQSTGIPQYIVVHLCFAF